MTLRTLYPEIEPFDQGMLPVSDLHTIYYELSGSPHGHPVVFLHGGPGGGVHPPHRRYFDPAFYKAVLFDQRGCGQSTPFAELRENTTWDLIKDIEKLRIHLGIERWLVFGGSWGSTLALAYAITHPERVVGLVLRGIFLCRKLEIDWFYQSGCSYLFPDAWEKFVAPIPPEERGDMVSAYHRRLTGADEAARLECAKAWSIWEATTSRLLIDEAAIREYDDAYQALPFACIENHYFFNQAFFESDSFLLEGARKISHIPTRIVQGRYDVVCPATSAWDLQKAMPSADVRISPASGHSAFEAENLSELVQATDDFKVLF